jgi:hypothetical protein
MHTRLAASARLAPVLLLVLAGRPTIAQQLVDGSWEMTAYESTASVGKASGLLTFGSDRFSLVYTMDEPGGQTSGRAHAGRFHRSGDTMTLEVDWTLESVSGKGQAQRGGGVRRTVKTAIDGDQLTLTFDNGAIQRFRRIR